MRAVVRGAAAGIVLMVALLACQAEAQRLDDPSRTTIIEALTPRKLRAIRGVNVSPGDSTDALASISLKVNFAYKSADLTTDAQLVLDNLGQALNDNALKDFRFRVAGHTDAVGGDDYNQRLSEARARAVREYLVARHRVAPERIVAVGFGKSRLIDAANPTSEINRRVEISNLGQ